MMIEPRQQAAGMAAGAEAEGSHFEPQAQSREFESLNSQTFPEWHSSSRIYLNGATSWDQVVKCTRWWGTTHSNHRS